MKKYLFISLMFFLLTALSAENLVKVQGGKMRFYMYLDGERIIHDIRVKDFYIGDKEITVAQWREFDNAVKYGFEWEGHYWGDIKDLSPGENCPIQLVKIEDVVSYCNWRSAKEGYEPVYCYGHGRMYTDTEADGYRLPSADEWDYAARGGRKTRRYIYAGSNDPYEVAWVDLPYEEGTHPVGTKKPNELGLYDMSGNIREWTWPDNGIPFPTGTSEEEAHLRGGDWFGDTESARLDTDKTVQIYLWNCVGFRVARNAE